MANTEKQTDIDARHSAHSDLSDSTKRFKKLLDDKIIVINDIGEMINELLPTASRKEDYEREQLTDLLKTIAVFQVTSIFNSAVNDTIRYIEELEELN